MDSWINYVKINNRLVESTSKESLINKINLCPEGDNVEKAENEERRSAANASESGA